MFIGKMYQKKIDGTVFRTYQECKAYRYDMVTDVGETIETRTFPTMRKAMNHLRLKVRKTEWRNSYPEVTCTNCHKRWRVTDSWATAVFFGAKDGDQLCGACYDTQKEA